MWLVFLCLSVGCVVIDFATSTVLSNTKFGKKHNFRLFYSLLSGVFMASVFMFIPIHIASAPLSFLNVWKSVLLSLINTIQMFTFGCEFEVVTATIEQCPSWLNSIYQVWAATLFFAAPAFTFGFVLSLFKNLLARIRFFFAFFRDIYVFSALNEKSFTLASDIKKNNKWAVIIFTDVFDDGEDRSDELIENARALGAICFKRDVLVINFLNHSKRSDIFFFAISEDETENSNHAIKLIELYKERQRTHLYVFSTKIESELLLTSIDKGKMKVRRVNEIQALINRLLFSSGKVIFKEANPPKDGDRRISAVVVGMGRHGTEMVKALTWYCQMDGYSVEINAFDKDALAKEKFIALAPELMSEKYNGVIKQGEAQYKITVHPSVDVDTKSFMDKIAEIKDATYVMVALGDDTLNISTSVKLKMIFERMGVKPIIHAIVYNSEQKDALNKIKNFQNTKYGIEFIGDMKSSYAESVIIDSELEELARQRHIKYGKPENDFWMYEYNYRSSMASAIHFQARKDCNIRGAGKEEDALTAEEKKIIGSIEHRRWNAYMRAEGYIYSGSKDPESRNDLGKMHNDLVEFEELSNERKNIDYDIGTL